MKYKVTGRQWHHLDHTQIICTLLETDNYISSSISALIDRPSDLPGAKLTDGKRVHQMSKMISYI